MGEKLKTLSEQGGRSVLIDLTLSGLQGFRAGTVKQDHEIINAYIDAKWNQGVLRNFQEELLLYIEDKKRFSKIQKKMNQMAYVIASKFKEKELGIAIEEEQNPQLKEIFLSVFEEYLDLKIEYVSPLVVSSKSSGDS